jgi:hypothetical protein
MNELAPPNRPQAAEPHQGAYPVSAYGHAALGHGSAQSAAIVSLVAGCKDGLEMHALNPHHSFAPALFEHGYVCVVA